jgi:uncharacterized membrane protein
MSEQEKKEGGITLYINWPLTLLVAAIITALASIGVLAAAAILWNDHLTALAGVIFVLAVVFLAAYGFVHEYLRSNHYRR